MRASAKIDYALRAAIELAAAGGGPVKGEQLASAQDIPLNFLENILGDLRQSNVIRAQRGRDGGYWLVEPPDKVTLADVIRAVDGPLASVRGVQPDLLEYDGNAESLRDVWIAVRSSLRSVLEKVTLADVAAGKLPASVKKLTVDDDAWQSHTPAPPT